MGHVWLCDMPSNRQVYASGDPRLISCLIEELFEFSRSGVPWVRLTLRVEEGPITRPLGFQQHAIDEAIELHTIDAVDLRCWPARHLLLISSRTLGARGFDLLPLAGPLRRRARSG